MLLSEKNVKDVCFFGIFLLYLGCSQLKSQNNGKRNG